MLRKKRTSAQSMLGVRGET